MKRKYAFVIAFAVLLNVLIFVVDTSPFVNLVTGEAVSDFYGKIIWCALFDMLLLFFAVKMSAIFDMPYEVLQSREIVWNLAKNDFKVKYVGSYLGVIWVFINPIVTILLYWLVFEFAFGSKDVNGYPFVLWLMAGLIPWFLIQEGIINGMNALLEYSYLVKKVMFRVSILPAVKVMSACFIHVAFMVVAIIIYVAMGQYPTLYTLQLFYYFFGMVAFLLALSYLTSAVVLFVRDLGQFISVFMQVFLWATPIMWNVEIIPQQWQWIFKLNPAYYIVVGYRDSLLYGVSVFQHMLYTLYFWVIVILMFVIGSKIFNKLKPHFADVL